LRSDGIAVDLLLFVIHPQPVEEMLPGRGQAADAWAAAGFEDTLLRWSLKSEGGNGYQKAVQSGVQV
jgi:hypothetical protein